ncbi:protein C-ets-1-like [Tropilaelaps mercedesae]|uniref:Protein C-ets-1-like n=1 Tax=Tropilaelaps mercedesae TaxID=418985 RepID=A0A1V9XCD9_9ACAR|nr:protein C-ets-1-like [Tropilaelaps mercedesae]
MSISSKIALPRCAVITSPLHPGDYEKESETRVCSRLSRRVDLSELENLRVITPRLDLPSQVPPLTPGTNQKMTNVLRASFSTWDKAREAVNTPRDPRAWSSADVRHWLAWAVSEFSLQGLDLCLFETLGGREICALGKEVFLAWAPPFTGDILWAHLDMLLKGEYQASALPTE